MFVWRKKIEKLLTGEMGIWGRVASLIAACTLPSISYSTELGVLHEASIQDIQCAEAHGIALLVGDRYVSEGDRTRFSVTVPKAFSDYGAIDAKFWYVNGDQYIEIPMASMTMTDNPRWILEVDGTYGTMGHGEIQVNYQKSAQSGLDLYRYTFDINRLMHSAWKRGHDSRGKRVVRDVSRIDALDNCPQFPDQ